MSNNEFKKKKNLNTTKLPSEKWQVLDFSFCEINDLNDLINQEPNSGKRQKIIVNDDNNDTNDNNNDNNVNNENSNKTIVKQKSILRTVAVRLCYNDISKLNGINKIFDKILLNPFKICWIDFSNNNISKISDDLIQCKNLQILYLHQNNIKSRKQILKLKQLPNLMKLTTFGNPIEQSNYYRVFMLINFNNLQTLDFIRITPKDQDDVLIYQETHAHANQAKN